MSPLGDAFELLYGRSDIDESTQHYRYRAVRRRWTLDGTSPAPPPQLEARAADLLAAVRSYAVTGTVAAPVIELTVEPGAQTGTVAYANFGLLDWTSWRVIGSPRWEGGVGRLRLPAVPLSRYGIHEGPWKPRWVWMVGGPGATYRAIRRRPMPALGAFNDFVPFPEASVPGPAGSVQLLYSNYGVPTAEW